MLGTISALRIEVMKYIMITLILLLLVGCVFCSPAANQINRQTVDTLDLRRFLGHWYEIARYDHRFERNLEQVETDYTLRADGEIEVVNRGIDRRTGEERIARGRARTTKRVGQLRVSFFWFFFSDYNILAVGPDYEWAVIGSRSPKYLWILAREPHLPPATMYKILHLIEQRGYPTAPLIFVEQPK